MRPPPSTLSLYPALLLLTVALADCSGDVAGTGGAASTSSSATGGSICEGPPCSDSQPQICVTTAPPCTIGSCSAGCCEYAPAPAGTPAPMQTVGDCQQIICDGNGTTTLVPDDTDMPAASAGSCLTGGCMGGAPVQTPKAADTPCISGDGGTAVCGAAPWSGTCVHCNTSSQCPAPLACIMTYCQ